MRLELGPDGYEKIDAGIQAVEDIAYEGVFDSRGAASRFRQIVAEIRKLRQIVREAVIIDPAAEAAGTEAA